MHVETVGPYVVVRRAKDGEVICDGRAVASKVHDIRFAHPDYQRNNKTRQSAMRALQRAGYK